MEKPYRTPQGPKNKSFWFALAKKLIPFLWPIWAHMQKFSPVGGLERPAHEKWFGSIAELSCYYKEWIPWILEFNRMVLGLFFWHFFVQISLLRRQLWPNPIFLEISSYMGLFIYDFSNFGGRGPVCAFLFVPPSLFMCFCSCPLFMRFYLSPLFVYFCLSPLLLKLSLSSPQAKSLHGGVRWGLGAHLPQPFCDFFCHLSLKYHDPNSTTTQLNLNLTEPRLVLTGKWLNPTTQTHCQQYPNT